MAKRRNFTDQFKAKIALEALRGDKTIQEIATKHQVHLNQVSTWKRQAVEGRADVFAKGDKPSGPTEAEVKDRHAKIGRLSVESDFLAPGHRIYPYLLKGMIIDRPGQVWCSDITYIPVRHGFLYLVAIMDWATRKVLAWRLSNTMHASFCVEALQEAIDTYGSSEIMNTDQGSQFTGADWITTLTKADVRVSMDGRGRYLDNIFIERLWQSLKQEAIYLTELQDGFHAQHVIEEWISFYNTKRPHWALEHQTPVEAYWASENQKQAA